MNVLENLNVLSIWKQQLNIFGIDLVNNICTIYMNTKHIIEENTIC